MYGRKELAKSLARVGQFASSRLTVVATAMMGTATPSSPSDAKESPLARRSFGARPSTQPPVAMNFFGTSPCAS